jgi:glycosyltransferase involved in cell wall biosynthesis/peptidoglycan/xylan/chitin deacetylase (PgdA/CDA1 family)
MILMYHKVFPTSPTEWWVEVDEFYRQMWEIQHRQVVYLSDYDPNNIDNVVITFDGVYSNILTYAAPILKKFGYPFELFIVGNLIGKDNRFDVCEPNARFANLRELEELEKVGGRLQWHTRTHSDMSNFSNQNEIIYELTIPGDLKSSRPNSFKWFAYTHGQYNSQVVEEVKKQFEGAVSCYQGTNMDSYQLNRVTVTNETKFRYKSVACIIASYNYGAFLTEAVESVLRQTVKPDEILISDDCSNDDTESIAREFVKLYPGIIKYNRNEKNLGIVDHFNRAVSMTNSEYVMILGADNRLLSDYIEKCVSVLESNPKIGIVYTDFYLFGSRAKLIYESYPKEWRGEVVDGSLYRVVFPEGKVQNPETLLKSNFIHGSSMIRREAFNVAGGYLKKNNRPEDYDLFYRILKSDYFAVKCNETSLQYRQHSLNQANEQYMSYATLLHYIEKSQRLEMQLRLVESAFWRKAAYPLILFWRQFKKFYSYSQKMGIYKAIKKAYQRVLIGNKTTTISR